MDMNQLADQVSNLADFVWNGLLLYLLVCAVSYLLSGHYSLYSSQMTLGPKLTNPPTEKQTIAQIVY